MGWGISDEYSEEGRNPLSRLHFANRPIPEKKELHHILSATYTIYYFKNPIVNPFAK